MHDTKFTPGPWRWVVNPKARTVEIESGSGKYGLEVMRLRRWGMQGAMPEFLSLPFKVGGHLSRLIEPCTKFLRIVKGREHHADWFQTIDHPDAHLIISAPELYDALETMLEYATDGSRHIEGIHNREEWYAARDHARSVLAKARGKTHE